MKILLAATSFLSFALVLAASTAYGEEQSFTSLFDGKSLDGWVGETEAYQVVEGEIRCRPGSGGNLYTERQYSDFILRFEFRLTPGANNGLGLRAPLEGDSAYVGIESQILDDSAAKYANVEPYQRHGSLYGVAPARRGFLKPVGEWNEQQVTCRGREIAIELNGESLLSVNLDDVAPGGKTLDGKPHPGLAREKGHIGFLGHGDRVDFRNVRIREIDE